LKRLLCQDQQHQPQESNNKIAQIDPRPGKINSITIKCSINFIALVSSASVVGSRKGTGVVKFN